MMLKGFTLFIVYEDGREIWRGKDREEIPKMLHDINYLQHSGKFKDVTIKCLFNPDMVMLMRHLCEEIDLADIKVQPLHVEEEKHIEEVRQSVEEQGLIVPLSVDLDNNLLDGHHRYRALKSLGVERIPVLKRSREWYRTMEHNIIHEKYKPRKPIKRRL